MCMYVVHLWQCFTASDTATTRSIIILLAFSSIHKKHYYIIANVQNYYKSPISKLVDINCNSSCDSLQLSRVACHHKCTSSPPTLCRSQNELLLYFLTSSHRTRNSTTPQFEHLLMISLLCISENIWFHKTSSLHNPFNVS